MSFLDLAGSALSNFLNFSLNTGKPIFREILRSRLWKSVIRSIVKLVLIFAAILVVIFSPFGEWWSELTTSAVFYWSLSLVIDKFHYDSEKQLQVTNLHHSRNEFH